MIAMQYSFVLPADYDMNIIERSIRDKGPMLDGFAHLRFKAYLSARQKEGGFASADNLYAPFYLWDEPEGISNFLTGPGFASLTRDYGWPQVRTWVVWHAELADDLSQARFATREAQTISAHSDLAALRAGAIESARTSVRDGALASVAAFDPTQWGFVGFRLWRELPVDVGCNQQLYRVGHISEGQALVGEAAPDYMPWAPGWAAW